MVEFDGDVGAVLDGNQARADAVVSVGTGPAGVDVCIAVDFIDKVLKAST